MPALESALTSALQTVIDPNTGTDFVSTRQLKNLRIDAGKVSFEVELGYPAKSQVGLLTDALTGAARGVAGVDEVAVTISSRPCRPSSIPRPGAISSRPNG